MQNDERDRPGKPGELVGQIAANINKCMIQEGKAWSLLLPEQPSDATERSMDALIARMTCI
jgi:hypothetical protein